MYKIQEIDEYDASGNSLVPINANFSIIDTRLCKFEEFRPNIDNWYEQMISLSASFNDFYTQVNATSAELRGMSNIVNAFHDIWLPPITIFYPNAFSVVANYQEILEWLNNKVTEFATNQIVKTQYSVKSFDNDLLSGTQLEKFTSQTLDSLSSTYKISSSDIKKYIVYDNHVKSIIAIISNLLKVLKLKLTIEKYQDLDILFNSISIHFNEIKCSLLPDIKEEDLLSIWSFLQQYQLLKDEYVRLKTLGIDAIPSNVVSKFDTRNIFTTYIGFFCFKYDGSKWKYLPSCDKSYCLNDQCNDCYDPVDVNSYYNSTDCALGAKYQLIECEA
jgi:hypothetical protein